MSHRVVIVGGGFGGLYAARALKRAPVSVTLIDRRNFHLFQPLLYQVATGGLAPGDISAPLRNILRRQKNVDVMLAEVIDIDAEGKAVVLASERVPYDTLIVAAGAQTSYFGHEEWADSAPGLKTIEDALYVRRRILEAFEYAEWESDAAARHAWLTFVVVGGGPTGVELAGAIAEIANDTLKSDFRHINPGSARVVLVEGVPRVLSTYPESLSSKARRALERLGVEVVTDTHVTQIDGRHVRLKTGDRERELQTRTVIWAAGVRVVPLGQALADGTGAPTDRAGRFQVEQDFSLPKHPDIFVVGDMATYRDTGGQQLPGVSPVAIQAGKYVAKLIARRIRGKPDPKPFKYLNRGELATIGRAKAVADVGPVHFAGLVAWLFWLFVHVMELAGYENRLLVLQQWAWNYFTRNRSTRLITGDARIEGASESDLG